MTLILWIALIACAVATASPAAAADNELWNALRQPGSVVVFRHSYAPGGFDPPDARLDDCSTQRNLDAAGRAQAVRTGEAFRRHGIVVGTVWSSPRCRCMDTARLAFGRVEAWDPLQGALHDQNLRQHRLAEIKARIAAHRDTRPLVLVTHGSVVSDLTGLNVRMGAFVVLQRTPDGTITVVGDRYIE